MGIRHYIAFFVSFFIIVSCVKCDIYADLTPQEYVDTRPETFYESIKFNVKDDVLFNSNSWELKDQSQEWQNKMRELGRQLKQANVGLIYFVHGTYAGEDPLGVVDFTKHALKITLPSEVETFFKNKMVDTILKDCGNYTEEYKELFKKAIGNDICCELFKWSSENNHFARLEASIRLIDTIAEYLNNKSLGGKRVLLLGHSHAGQLFALMTNFIAQSTGVDRLRDIATEAGLNMSKLDEHLKRIRNVQLDIVTFGTPPRYGWGEGNYNLLNIINHRGDEYLADNIDSPYFILGTFITQEGDYVQHWGIAGSDTPAKTQEKRRANTQLDETLGKGFDVLGLKSNVKKRMRVPHYGKTILVDYRDNGTYYPNCDKTLFGHGVYTRGEKMLFNTQLIVDKMYSIKP